jgi:hypothetical protein
MMSWARLEICDNGAVKPLIPVKSSIRYSGAANSVAKIFDVVFGERRFGFVQVRARGASAHLPTTMFIDNSAAIADAIRPCGAR